MDKSMDPPGGKRRSLLSRATHKIGKRVLRRGSTTKPDNDLKAPKPAAPKADNLFRSEAGTASAASPTGRTLAARQELREHFKDMAKEKAVFCHSFPTDRSLGFTICVARYGESGRRFIQVDATSPACDLYNKLKPSDELIAINDQLIYDVDEAGANVVKAAIKSSADRRVKLTFVKGEHRDAADRDMHLSGSFAGKTDDRRDSILGRGRRQRLRAASEAIKANEPVEAVKAHVQRASDERVRAHQLADQAHELAKAVTNDPGSKHYAEQTRLMAKAHAREASECARSAGKLLRKYMARKTPSDPPRDASRETMDSEDLERLLDGTPLSPGAPADENGFEELPAEDADRPSDLGPRFAAAADDGDGDGFAGTPEAKEELPVFHAPEGGGAAQAVTYERQRRRRRSAPPEAGGGAARPPPRRRARVVGAALAHESTEPAFHDLDGPPPPPPADASPGGSPGRQGAYTGHRRSFGADYVFNTGRRPSTFEATRPPRGLTPPVDGEPYRILKSGLLKKQSGGLPGSGWKSRCFDLVADDVFEGVRVGPTLRYRRSLDGPYTGHLVLDGADVVASKDVNGSVFHVHYPLKRSVRHLRAADAEDRAGWVDAIHAAVAAGRVAEEAIVYPAVQKRASAVEKMRRKSVVLEDIDDKFDFKDTIAGAPKREEVAVSAGTVSSIKKGVFSSRGASPSEKPASPPKADDVPAAGTVSEAREAFARRASGASEKPLKAARSPAAKIGGGEIARRRSLFTVATEPPPIFRKKQSPAASPSRKLFDKPGTPAADAADPPPPVAPAAGPARTPPFAASKVSRRVSSFEATAKKSDDFDFARTKPILLESGKTETTRAHEAEERATLEAAEPEPEPAPEPEPEPWRSRSPRRAEPQRRSQRPRPSRRRPAS
ncbi:hypothetical protein JL721_7993 [Aureococcus anophagefferens]|nr:hypothetical protein JL721_7993 [Aureococcus anophagefferens]